MPVFAGHLTADQSIIDALDGDPVMGFAGIGRPNRFFTSLKAAGANLVRSLAFADHHPYSEADLVRLQEDAARLGAALVTTNNDCVRLPAECRERIWFFPVSLDLVAADALVDAIIATIAEKGA